MSDTDLKNDEYWREVLSPDEFDICRKHGTERPFTGQYWDEKTAGIYHCRCCGEPLFDSDTKYDSGSGWPSFFNGIQKAAIKERVDTTLGMTRTEILCSKCDCHLGHVFTDGPAPTGLRYCVNSASIRLEPSARSDSKPSAELDSQPSEQSGSEGTVNE